MKKKLLFTLFYLVFQSIIAQEESSDKAKWLNLKLNLVNAGMVFQPNITFGAEFLVGQNKNFGLEPAAGYVFYSTEEGVKANGFRLSQTFNSYFKQTKIGNLGVSITGFYQAINLKSPLLVNKNLNGFTYNEYQNMKYTKRRIGGSMDFLIQAAVIDNWVLDVLIGLRATEMITRVPAGVAQEDFPNGLLYGTNLLVPGINFGLKAGFSF